VGQKSKLLTLSEYVYKTEKIGVTEQMRTATEKIKHCVIFSRKIFYVTIVLCLNILLPNILLPITRFDDTTRPLRKHDVIKV